MVAVLNKKSHPLMPCSARTARLLLAQGKAKIVSKDPFTIRLLYGSSGYKQDTKECNTAKDPSNKPKNSKRHRFLQEPPIWRVRSLKKSESKKGWKKITETRKRRRYV